MIARIAVALALLAAQPALAGELQWLGSADSLNAELRYSDAEKTDIPDRLLLHARRGYRLRRL